MLIVKIPIAEVRPYERNAKTHTPEQVAKIAESIRLFCMNDPLGIWGDKNIIIEGHGRLLALQSLGHT